MNHYNIVVGHKTLQNYEKDATMLCGAEWNFGVGR